MFRAPLEVVQRQFDAYNERHLERFLANFSESFKGYRMPSLEPTITDWAPVLWVISAATMIVPASLGCGFRLGLLFSCSL